MLRVLTTLEQEPVLYSTCYMGVSHSCWNSIRIEQFLLLLLLKVVDEDTASTTGKKLVQETCKLV